MGNARRHAAKRGHAVLGAVFRFAPLLLREVLKIVNVSHRSHIRHH